jgi:hypothetical protein
MRALAARPLPLRFVHEIGVRVALRRYWDGPCAGYGYHNAMVVVKDVRLPNHESGAWLDSAQLYFGGDTPAPSDERWPRACTACAAPAPADAVRQLFHERLYDSLTGDLQPGDAFLTVPWTQRLDGTCREWDNCAGQHLVVVCPDGTYWDVDSRASNCTLPADRLHRCWVRHGVPPAVTVNKAGHTCSAGAGSIQTHTWHGYLQNGLLVDC